MFWKSLFLGTVLGCIGTFYAGFSLWGMGSNNIYYSEADSDIRQPESNIGGSVLVDDPGSAPAALKPAATGEHTSGPGKGPDVGVGALGGNVQPPKNPVADSGPQASLDSGSSGEEADATKTKTKGKKKTKKEPSQKQQGKSAQPGGRRKGKGSISE